jgi:hypothetical protein
MSDSIDRLINLQPGNQRDFSPSRRDLLKSMLVLLGGAAIQEPTVSAAEETAGWVKYPQNPLLSLGAEGEFDSQNIFAPAVAREEGKYTLYYSGGPSGPANGGKFVRYQLGMALSDDGYSWRKLGRPLLPLGERDDFHATPALLRHPNGDLAKPGGWRHLVFCGNRQDDVEYATSRDGISWQKHSASPIYRNAYAPNLIQLPGEVRMYYIHKPPKQEGRMIPWEIHLATGKDLFSLRPHRANPLLVVSQPWERRALFYPYVLREGSTWVLFYAAYWNRNAEGPTSTAIGMATSEDGIGWSKSDTNPVVAPTEGSAYDSRYTSSQAVLPDRDGYRMYYASRIDMQHKYYAIALASKRGGLL